MSAGRMVPEVKTAWVQALRSGEYQQIRGALVGRGGYCCLGVLCDLALKAGVEIEPEDEGYVWLNDGVQNSTEGDLPLPVRDWSGLSSAIGVLPAPVEEAPHLIGLNDDLEYTFEQIADVIEAQL